MVHGLWTFFSCSGSALSLLNKDRWAAFIFQLWKAPGVSSIKEHMCDTVKHMDMLRLLCAWFAGSLHSAQLGVASGHGFLMKLFSVLYKGDALFQGFRLLSCCPFLCSAMFCFLECLFTVLPWLYIPKYHRGKHEAGLERAFIEHQHHSRTSARCSTRQDVMDKEALISCVHEKATQ